MLEQVGIFYSRGSSRPRDLTYFPWVPCRAGRFFTTVPPEKSWYYLISPIWGFPGGSEGKASAYNAGDPGLIPKSGRFPGEGNGNPLQGSCLENPMDRGAWQATIHMIARSQTSLLAQTVKNLSAMQETGSNLWGEGYSNPLQFSYLENSIDKGVCWATVHGVAKSHT